MPTRVDQLIHLNSVMGFKELVEKGYDTATIRWSSS